MKFDNPYIVVAFAWIFTAIAVGVGLYITKNANCLWCMLLPAMMEVRSK